jgi:hypothetical protein
MDQKQVLERWLRQLKKNEISPDAVGLGPDKEKALQFIREELEKIEAMEKKQTHPISKNEYYSHRRATTGSIFAAFRAGSTPAVIPIKIPTMLAIRNHSGA